MSSEDKMLTTVMLGALAVAALGALFGDNVTVCSTPNTETSTTYPCTEPIDRYPNAHQKLLDLGCTDVRVEHKGPGRATVSTVFDRTLYTVSKPTANAAFAALIKGVKADISTAQVSDDLKLRARSSDICDALRDLGCTDVRFHHRDHNSGNANVSCTFAGETYTISRRSYRLAAQALLRRIQDKVDRAAKAPGKMYELEAHGATDIKCVYRFGMWLASCKQGAKSFAEKGTSRRSALSELLRKVEG